MGTRVNIDKFGIETELITSNVADRSLVNNAYFNIGEGKGAIEVCKDDEFYESQLEFKLKATSFNDCESKLDTWKSFIGNKINHKDGWINGADWVGTHIHLFLNNADGEPLTSLLEVKVPILHYYMKLMVSHFSQELFYNGVGKEYYELERIVRSHSIWRKFDSERMKEGLRGNQRLHNFDYVNFRQGTDKMKYAPIIWSMANEETGKPLSLEIRLIPNSYLLETPSEDLAQDLKNVEFLINNRVNKNSNEYKNMLKEIGIFHLLLCGAYRRNTNSGLLNYIKNNF